MMQVSTGTKVRVDQLPRLLRNLGNVTKLEFYEVEPAVYFLVLRGEIVYIGQSVRPRSRIAQHVAEGSKEFDSVFLKHCAAEDLDKWESTFIHSFEPRYNCTLPNGQKLAPHRIAELQSEAREILDFTLSKSQKPREQHGLSRQVTNDAAPEGNSSFSRPAGLRLIRLPELMSMVGLGKTSIFGLAKTGRFPKPLKIGRASVWEIGDIERWIEAQQHARAEEACV